MAASLLTGRSRSLVHEFADDANPAAACCWHCHATYADCIANPRPCLPNPPQAGH